MEKNDKRSFSVKVGDEWLNVGNVGENKFDASKTTVTIKVSKKLKELINSKPDDALIFCNLYQPKGDKPSQHSKAKADGYAPAPDLDDSLPF